MLMLRILVFWGVTLGGKVYRLQCLKGTLIMDPTSNEYEGVMFLQNISILRPPTE